MNKETMNWSVYVAVAFAVLFVFTIAHDLYEAPEIVTVTEIKEIEVAASCPVCEVCEVCEEYDSEFVADYTQDQDVYELLDEALTDDDFKEDLVEWMNSQYELNIEDVDDLEFVLKEHDIVWNDREDGEAVVEIVLKTEYILDGDDEDTHTKRINVSFVLDDEDLEEFDEYEFEDY